MQRITAFFGCVLLHSTLSAAPGVVDPGTAFQQARAEIAARKFAAAAVTLDSAIAAAAEYTDERQKREALTALHFYAGVANVGILEETVAAQHLQKMFRLNPSVRLTDPDRYQVRFVQVFNRVAERNQSPDAQLSQLVFSTFYPGFPAFRNPNRSDDTNWGTLPALALLADKAEKRDWANVSVPADREAFIRNFWKKRDPTPETPENEFRAEFERRVAFASRMFPSPDGNPVSDRGRVFILLGEPGFVERRPIKRGEDSIQVIEPFTTINGTIERWVYRGEHLPLTTSKKYVQFRFVTQKGIGDGILQREDAFGMRALLAAATVARTASVTP